MNKHLPQTLQGTTHQKEAYDRCADESKTQLVPLMACKGDSTLIVHKIQLTGAPIELQLDC